MFRQVTSAPASQHSVLIIHAFSPFIIGAVKWALARQKKSAPRDWLYIRAALAEESISVQAGISPSRCGAKGCGTYSSTDVLDFLLTQGASASTKQYSVLVIHIFSFCYWTRCAGPKLCKRVCSAALRRSRTR